MKLLLNIENTTIKELSAKTGITQGHINIILLELQKDGLIDRVSKNRHIGDIVRPSVYYYSWTEKGDKIAGALRLIKGLIER